MKVSSFAKELFGYLRNPLFIETTHGDLKNKSTDILSAYLVCLPALVSLLIVINLFDRFIVQQLFDYSINAHKLNPKTAIGRNAWLFILLIGPLFEEIIFRLPLKLRRTGLGLSSGVLIYRLIAPHFFVLDFNGRYYLAIGAAMIVFLFFMFVFPNHVIEQIKGRYFKYFFYFSAIIFGLAHILNYDLNIHLFLVYPLYILPQFAMGLCIAYVRMKHGFLSGWGLHALFNLPGALFL